MTVLDLDQRKLSGNGIKQLSNSNCNCRLKVYLSFRSQISTMADDGELKKRRTFRKFTYRGVDLDQLLDMNNEQLMELFVCRIRRKFSRGLKRSQSFLQ